MKRIVIGILAHVDSGKTTLSEALLYRAGEIRKLGRVDHKNSFLDNDPIERSRGITIFSKQALLHTGDTEITLLDTPGHVDFSAETERTLQVLDCAVLVVSATDGVQSHTETLWRLLERYNVPVFIFVNKTDISYLGRDSLMNELKRRLNIGCVDFGMERSTLLEELAECDEDMMNSFLDSGDIPEELIRAAASKRRLFPCLFGSALKITGVDELLSLLDRYAVQPKYPEEFGARVYKISQDAQGSRLTHLKVTGGTLRVRTQIGDIKEKITQIRIYSGEKYSTADEVSAGTVCAVTGLSSTAAGEGLGAESGGIPPLLEPVLTYKVILPPDIDTAAALTSLRALEEEDPQLRIVWSSSHREILIQLMGEIQLEILKSIIEERFGFKAEFDQGSISYRETIAAPVLGCGHYEPLRHYAEVQLLLEPLERGSGLRFAVDCRKDSLDLNFQRLVLTHLEEKVHIGALTGSPITDMKITLVAGRAHIKHTEGGDFRQATYRAVRQGLRSAQSVLLEPWYDFRLEIPPEHTGRALTDLQRMCGEFGQPLIGEENAVIIGSAPVSEMRGYLSEVVSYTRGKGRLSCVTKGFLPCHNADEVISAIGYDCDSDTDNPADSVFCSHGAGVIVKWNEAPARMHTDSGISLGGSDDAPEEEPVISPRAVSDYRRRVAEDKELMEIFERTYGKINRAPRASMRTEKHAPPKVPKLPAPPKGPEYLLVDGYNIIFAWDELNELSKESLDLARTRLINILCNYQGFRQCRLILVFDAYRVKGNHREIETVNNITVVYTKEAETADMYIEKAAHDLGKNHKVRVATSDRVEQIIIMGSGAVRVSAGEFREEVAAVEKAIRDIIENN